MPSAPVGAAWWGDLLNFRASAPLRARLASDQGFAWLAGVNRAAGVVSGLPLARRGGSLAHGVSPQFPLHAQKRKSQPGWLAVLQINNLRGFGVERVKGIEPSYAAWEAAVLPLNYTRPAVAEDRKRAGILKEGAGVRNWRRGKIGPLPIAAIALMIQLYINGRSETVDDALTVAGLLQQRGLAGKRLAVERNGEIVPRARHADTVLADGDRLEIVVAVGGG